ncbi:MAG TPA: MBL fold metallo-hydrolase [Methanospirillum sp.]|nr:MBL fold metallo-hydrolase [Methanospirillum sp.]
MKSSADEHYDISSYEKKPGDRSVFVHYAYIRMSIPQILMLISLFLLISPVSSLSIHFLDVGQGDAALIEHRGHAMLIDAGDPDAGSRILSYLQKQGIFSLDVLIATHPHSDHIGGMTDILNAIAVSLFIDNGAIHTSPTYRTLMKTLIEKQIPYGVAREGDLIPFTDDITIRVISPAELSGDLNEDSLAFVLTYGEVRVFFTGDCEHCDASCDVVKLAHHGSKGSASRGILKGDVPDLAIISLGRDNEYYYPAPSTIHALESAGVGIVRTDERGTIVLRTDGRRYWLDE